MKPSLPFLVVLPLVSALSACVPFPHEHCYAPALDGVLTKGGQPVSNAKIRVTAEFSDKHEEATTDDQGAFHTGAIQGFEFWASLIGDPLFGYTVSITEAGHNYPGLTDISVGYAPEKVTLVCELSKPVQLRNRSQYCSVRGT